MQLKTIELNIDDSVNISELQARIQKQMDDEAEESLLKREFDKETKRILECDRAMQAWAQAKLRVRRYLNSETFDVPIAIVRANTYDEVCSYQELYNLSLGPSFWRFQNDPRRPVMMKGSQQYLRIAYGLSSGHSDNGYCLSLFDEIIKRYKITCFDRNEWLLFRRRIEAEFRKKYNLSYHYGNKVSAYYGLPGRDWNGDYSAIIGGKHVYLTSNQFKTLAKMQQIIRKTETASERLSLLKQYRQDQNSGTE